MTGLRKPPKAFLESSSSVFLALIKPQHKQLNVVMCFTMALYSVPTSHGNKAQSASRIRLKFAFCTILFLLKIRYISLMASTVPGLDTRLFFFRINVICGVCSKRSMEWLSLCVMWIHVFSYQNSMSHWSVYGYMILDGRPSERGLYCKYPSARLGVPEANALFPLRGPAWDLTLFMHGWWDGHGTRMTGSPWSVKECITNRWLFSMFET